MDIKKLLSENESELLQGGTVGEVKLIKGDNFNYVLKTQRKWERHGDPDCWRREYDIYVSEFEKTIPHIKIPQCYHKSTENDTTYLVMEYINGRTGVENIDVDELSYTANKIGKFHREYHNCNLPWLRNYPAVISSYDLWYGKIKDSLHESDFPDDIHCLLNDYTARKDEIFHSFNVLPRTVCHGDVHHDNIIILDDDVYLIDWDSAGYGYMGEDAVDMLCEAFIYSDRDVKLMSDYKKRIITAYCDGAEITLDDTVIQNIFIMSWGFRIAALWFYYHDNPNMRQRCIDILRIMSNSPQS
jgi:Phosphotransferase enzyme family.